jgi:hypothetical protein
MDLAHAELGEAKIDSGFEAIRLDRMDLLAINFGHKDERIDRAHLQVRAHQVGAIDVGVRSGLGDPRLDFPFIIGNLEADDPAVIILAGAQNSDHWKLPLVETNILETHFGLAETDLSVCVREIVESVQLGVLCLEDKLLVDLDHSLAFGLAQYHKESERAIVAGINFEGRKVHFLDAFFLCESVNSQDDAFS